MSEESLNTAASVKETIESILVAFILAFIFRAFVVEAFVIPTGSMATTLDGAHFRFRCPDCGYVFDVNYGNGGSEDANRDPDYCPDDIYCPNCGFRVANGPERTESGNPISHGGQLQYPFGTQPERVHYGDRILVLKYAYLLHPPRRWDVVVFKTPYNPDEDHYTVNYIKRLVGEPGDTLMVLDGSLYKKSDSGAWEILRRPYSAQQALWRIINDNDFYPQGLPRDQVPAWHQPWTVRAGDGWNLGQSGADGRTFHFAGQGQGTIGFEIHANPTAQSTDGYLVYDMPRQVYTNPHPGSEDPVSDLKLSACYQRTSGSGPINLLLSKRDHAFVAEIGPQSATLWHDHPDGTRTKDAGPINLSDFAPGAASPLSLEFSNVDYKVTLRINGKDALETTADEYVPDVDELRREFTGEEPARRNGPPRIEIAATDQTCSLSHVSLWKNVYYTNHGVRWATPTNPVHLHRRGEAREDGFSGTYSDDEFFTMGDNSLISLDARFWSQSINLPYEDLYTDSGRVPSRFILGKAFFVYWPAGYSPTGLFPSLIPDFGDMRFIH